MHPILVVARSHFVSSEVKLNCGHLRYRALPIPDQSRSMESKVFEKTEYISLSEVANLPTRTPAPTHKKVEPLVQKIVRDGWRKYEVKSIIGKGGYAHCYSAIASTNKKRVVVKTMAKENIKTSQAQQRLRNEVTIHRKVQNPAIVKFLAYFEDKYNVYIVIDFCPNRSLLDLVTAKGTLPEHESARIFAKILEGVLYLHERRIHHGDLKLANILLDDKMEPKVTDFGFSQQLNSPNELRTRLCGTPAYMAPEILAKPCRFGLPSDVWALGVMLYTMAYGCTAFDSKTLDILYHRIRTHDLRFPKTKQVTKLLVELIKGILNPDPIYRLHIKQVMMHEWLKANYIQQTMEKSRSQRFLDIVDAMNPKTARALRDMATQSIKQRFNSMNTLPPT